MLDRTSYFIREHIGFLKLSNVYDILDPDSQQQLGVAKEKPGKLIHILRFFVNKQMLPTKVVVYEGNNPEDESRVLFSIHRRGISFLRSKVTVCDPSGNVFGSFKSKVFALGGAFRVFDADDKEIALVKGDWKGWNFRFLNSAEDEIGTITKKWTGIGKELFTSADNYIISLAGEPSRAVSMLLLAAGLAVDTIYKET